MHCVLFIFLNNLQFFMLYLVLIDLLFLFFHISFCFMFSFVHFKKMFCFKLCPNCEMTKKAHRTKQINMPCVCSVPLLYLDWSAASSSPAPALVHVSVTSWKRWDPWQPSLCPSPAARQITSMLITSMTLFPYQKPML